MATQGMFVSWDENNENSKKMAFATAAKALEKSQPIFRTSGSDIFKDIVPNQSVRDGFSRRDYNAFRPEDATPSDSRLIKLACINAYKRIGLIRNIIDLMADFTVQGVHLAHPNKRIEKFYNEWWNKVNGTERSERFANYLYKVGAVIVQRTTAKLKARDVDNLKQGYTSGDADVVPEPPIEVKKNEIPWRYTFLNPLTIDIMGDDLATFANIPMYAMKVPPSLLARIRNPRNAVDAQIVNAMPRDIVELARQGARTIPLNPNKVFVFHYKKDDWEPWADPILYSIMDDLVMLNKMKLADLAALDGAISHIRLWRLGSLEHKILPTNAAVQRLADMLINNVGGGAMDLIWGPELEIQETKTDIYKFLGQEKYGPTLNAIYAGLGIPPTLTGAANAAGFTNNYISLKTLTERLNYVRMILTDFWDREIKIVQRAMGFRSPAQVIYERMSLSDEAAEKNLLIQLADRNIISWETVVERFGEITDLERQRLSRNNKDREFGRLPRKAGPWFNPEQKEALEKIALQTGVVTPSEVGLELKPKKDGEEAALKMKQPSPFSANPNSKGKGQPQKGRPANSKDTEKRKQKKVLPRTAAEFTQSFAWARKAQKYISDVIDPTWLEVTGKKNMRSLSDEESHNVEHYKFAVLCSLDIYDELNEEKITSAAYKNDLCIPTQVDDLCCVTSAKYLEKYGKEASIDEIRQIQASAYALFKGDFDGEDSD